jgi:iron complex transport system substrate-binding protein
MAPSVTEVLFALGLGDRVVGVTRYCDYPPEALDKKSVGGFLDPNFEVILRLQPDLVVLLPVHGDARRKIEDLGIQILEVDHRTLEGILASITEIGEACGTEQAASEVLDDIERRTSTIANATKDLPRPTVLLSSARNLGTGAVAQVFAAGKNQWYDDIITMAGGANAYTNEGVQFPELSPEGLIRLDPDVVVELAPDLERKDRTPEELISEWDSLSVMRAVANKNIHVLSGDYVSIPGPRFVFIVEDLAKILHPGIEWESHEYARD